MNTVFHLSFFIRVYPCLSVFIRGYQYSSVFFRGYSWLSAARWRFSAALRAA